MPVLFRIIQSNRPTADGVKLFHPRAVHVGSVSTEIIAKEIAEYSSLSTGDVKNTIDNLVAVMTRHLQSSEVVTLDGLGSFKLSMRSLGKGAETQKDVKASRSAVRVLFRPSSTRSTGNTIATRSLITGVKCVPYKLDQLPIDQTGDDNTSGGDGGNTGGNDSGSGDDF